APVDELGGEGALGVLAHLAAEDELDLVGSTQVQVVGDQALDQAASATRGIEDQGPRDLDLAHGELPPVAALPLGRAQRGGDDIHPAVEEGLDLLRAEAVTDSLQPSRVAASGEAVGELGEGETFGLGLLLGPLMAIEPDLCRVREVRAELDEARSELGIPYVEVVDRHPAVGLPEPKANRAGLSGVVVTDRDGLELLGDTDRDHARGTGGLVQEGAHGVDLALVLLELEQGDALTASEGLDSFSEVVTDGGEECRRGDGITQVVGEEGDHLAANLKGGDVGVEVDAIEALKIEDDVLIEELVDVGRHGSFGLGAGMATKGDTTKAWRRESRSLGERPQGSALTPGLCHPGSSPGGVTK